MQAVFGIITVDIFSVDDALHDSLGSGNDLQNGCTARPFPVALFAWHLTTAERLDVATVRTWTEEVESRITWKDRDAPV